MIYLDYSATTKPDEEVIDEFVKTTEFFGNPNSNYSIALEANKQIEDSTKIIAELLNIKPNELIFTSGASESNNTAIKGVSLNQERRHIITTPFEHSSVTAPLGYLQKLGYKVDFVKMNEQGLVDIDNLKKLITKDTFLISIGAVNSELGFRQPIEQIADFLKDKDIIFHSDITQCLGKDEIDLTNVDLASFSAHKIFGFKGIGGLIKKEHIKLVPLIHGGKSTTIYRSGTPQTELICSLRKSLELSIPFVKERKEYVKNLTNIITNELKKYDIIHINSSEYSIPQIINMSVIGKNSNDTQKYFEQHGIYLSTKTACATNNDMSYAVYEHTKDEKLATSSIRVSISYKTTIEEVNEFINCLKRYIGVENENN